MISTAPGNWVALGGLTVVNSECGEDEDTLDKRGKNDGDGQNRSRCTGVTASCFSCFGSEDTDSDSASECCERDCECFSKYHDISWFGVGYLVWCFR